MVGGWNLCKYQEGWRSLHALLPLSNFISIAVPFFKITMSASLLSFAIAVISRRC